MYGRWLPSVNAEPHIGVSSVIRPPSEITSTKKNFLKSEVWLEDKTSKNPISQNENCVSDTLASAKSFKSKKRRRYCGEKYAWNGHTLWIFFLQNFLIIHAMGGPVGAEQCALGINTPGRTWPSGDIILEHGQPLRIYCILNENSKDPRSRVWNASDMVFRRGDAVVEPEYITVVNETTSMLYIDQPAPSQDMYFCEVRSYDSRRPVAICLNSVTIGFKPEEPRNFKCVSYNWQRLVCTWEPVPNYIKTSFSLAFRLPGRAGRTMFDCPLQSREPNSPPNTCMWTVETHPHYRQVYETFAFTLTGENQLGTNLFYYEFRHFEHVIPSEPRNLAVVNKTSSNALLHWSVPYPMVTFPPGLSHRVSYRNEQDPQDKWTNIDITNQKHPPEIYFNLTDLKHANAVYTVRVSLRSRVAVSEDMWGQFSEITFKTRPTVPGLPPKTDIGSFEISGNGDSRDVYIYWQVIPKCFENGDNFTYHVVDVQENGRSLDLQPQKITRTYAKFEGISLNSLTFDIVTANCIGMNEHKATVRVPRQTEMPQKPTVFTKIAFGGGVYELSWNSSSSPDVVDYTVFWCESERDRPYQCTGYLDWIHVPEKTRMYNVTVSNPEKIYQFAITANTAEASSGMAWVSGMTTLSNVVGKVKSVRIINIESSLIQVGWELDYSGRLGVIESFNIHYCPIVSAENLTCDDPKMVTTVTPSSNMRHGVIRNLRPYTTYLITVAVMTENGEGLNSDAVYTTTLSTVEDPVPNYSHELIDGPTQPATDSFDVIVSTEIERSAFHGDHLVAEIKQHSCDGDVDCQPDRMSEPNSDSANRMRQISDLNQIISAYEGKLDTLTEENRKLRDRPLQCNEIW